MDEKIMLELKKDRIAKMKNPTILLNQKDFEELQFETGKYNTYNGIPVKTSCLTDRGSVIIYDDISR